MEFCQCKDTYHKDNPYEGVCNMRIKKDFANCYFCYKNHIIEDEDGTAGSGENQFYQQGEDVDFQ